jgi:WD40 repeat protein
VIGTKVVVLVILLGIGTKVVVLVILLGIGGEPVPSLWDSISLLLLVRTWRGSFTRWKMNRNLIATFGSNIRRSFLLQRGGRVYLVYSFDLDGSTHYRVRIYENNALVEEKNIASFSALVYYPISATVYGGELVVFFAAPAHFSSFTMVWRESMGTSVLTGSLPFIGGTPTFVRDGDFVYLVSTVSNNRYILKISLQDYSTELLSLPVYTATNYREVVISPREEGGFHIAAVIRGLVDGTDDIGYLTYDPVEGFSGVEVVHSNPSWYPSEVSLGVVSGVPTVVWWDPKGINDIWGRVRVARRIDGTWENEILRETPDHLVSWDHRVFPDGSILYNMFDGVFTDTCFIQSPPDFTPEFFRANGEAVDTSAFSNGADEGGGDPYPTPAPGDELSLTSISNPETPIPNIGRCGKISPDGNFLAIGSSAVSNVDYLHVYKLPSLEKINLGTLPNNSAVYDIDFTPDSQYMLVTLHGANRIQVWQISGETFTLLTDNVDVQPTSTGRVGKFSDDGAFAAVGYASGDRLNVYSRSGGNLTLVQTLGSQLVAAPTYLSFSPSANYLAAITTNTVVIFKRDGSTFTAIPDVVDAPTGTLITCAFDPTGEYLAIGGTDYPQVSVYRREGDTFTKLSPAVTAPGGRVKHVSWYPTGQFLLVAYDTIQGEGGVLLYRLDPEGLQLIGSQSDIPDGSTQSLGSLLNANYAGVFFGGSPYMKLYEVL